MKTRETITEKLTRTARSAVEAADEKAVILCYGSALASCDMEMLAFEDFLNIVQILSPMLNIQRLYIPHKLRRSCLERILRAYGYEMLDTSLARGYVSRVQDFFEIQTADGRRKGQPYIKIACDNSTQYHHRQYLRKMDYPDCTTDQLQDLADIIGDREIMSDVYEELERRKDKENFCLYDLHNDKYVIAKRNYMEEDIDVLLKGRKDGEND